MARGRFKQDGESGRKYGLIFMPAVSVIIPTYNRADFILASVNSVLQQTFRDFELIVVDDGSSDNTAAVLQPLLGQLRYVKRQERRGPSAARNVGIKLATADWLSFLDSDDLWLPQKLAQQMEFLRANPEAKICYTEEIWYRQGRRVNPGKVHRKYSGWIYQRLLPLCIISPSSVVIHRSVFVQIGGFDETMPAGEDYDLWLRIGARYPIYLISVPLIVKRNGHPGQQSQEVWGIDRFRIVALQKMLTKTPLSPADRQATLAVWRRKCEIFANGCEKRGKIAEANYYRQLVQLNFEELNDFSTSAADDPAAAD